LAFGQVPIKLFSADVIKPREILSTGLERSRVMSLARVTTNIDLDSWGLVSFTTQHLNNGGHNIVNTSSVNRQRYIVRNLTPHTTFLIRKRSYHPIAIISSLIFFANVFSLFSLKGTSITPPSVSSNKKPISYAPPSAISSIGFNAPSLKNVATGKVQQKTVVKKISRKKALLTHQTRQTSMKEKMF
jgi:hypothetical protein